MLKAIGQFTITDFHDVNISSVEPQSPVTDQLWLDSSVIPNVIKRWNGTSWELVSDYSDDIEDIRAAAEAALIESAKAVTGTQNLIPFIQSTHTTSTASWTANAPFSELVHGQQITFQLQQVPTGSATLNLTLADGTTQTGALLCYYSGTTRLTTHYSQGNVIRLTYLVNNNIGGANYTGWWADANYADGNTYDRILYNRAIVAKSAITAGYMIVSDNTDKFYHMLPNVSFDIDKPLLYAASSIVSAATGSNNYTVYPSSISIRTNGNSSMSLTAYKSIYIKGILNGLTFTPTDPNLYTDTPVDDGSIYMIIGQLYDTYRFTLYGQHELYTFSNGVFKSFSQIAYEAQNKIDNLKVGGRNLLLKSDIEVTSTREYVMYRNIAYIFDTYGIGQYTFSFDLKSAIAGNIQVYCTDRVTSEIKYTYPTKIIDATTEYKRYSMTVNVTVLTALASTTALSFYGTYDTGRIPSIKNVKIEAGNIATDWTPAPEDVQEQIDKNKNEILDMGNDTKLTPTDKKRLKTEWEIIVSEKTSLNTQATNFSITTENTNYNTAYTNLNTYLNTTHTVFSNMSVTTTIPDATAYRNLFKDYYDKKTILLNAISTKAKSLADTAQTTANNANTSATTANNLLADIAADNKVTAVEKKTLKQEWDIIVAEKPVNTTQADNFGIDTTNYTAKYNALNTYLNTTYTMFSSLSTTTVIDSGTTLRLRFKEYYDARTELFNNISTKAKLLAEMAQGSKNGISFRYVRDWLNGNNLNGNNHWVELKVLSGNTNRATGKIPITGSGFTLANSGLLTDNITNTTSHVSVSPAGKSYVQIDLGQVYSDIDTIHVWHYHTDGRIYNDTKTEVSPDGVIWFTVFDSAISGKYVETVNGNKIIVNPNLILKNTSDSVSQALSLLDDISNDNKLTPSEKHDLKKEWDTILLEYPTLLAQANTFVTITTEKTNFTNAYNALNTYVVTTAKLFESLTTTIDINGETLRTNFKNYYNTKALLQKKITDTAKALADSAQSAADDAQDDANTALGALTDIASDNKITPVEKIRLKTELEVIVTEKPINDSQADIYGIIDEKTVYGTKYTTLYNYLNPLLANITTTSDVNGVNLRTYFKEYYEARTNLLKLIAIKTREDLDTIDDELIDISTTDVDYLEGDTLISTKSHDSLVDLMVYGNTEQRSEYVQKLGESYQYTNTRVIGKNLFNCENLTLGLETIYNSGTIIINPTATYRSSELYIDVKPNTQYTLKATMSGGSNSPHIAVSTYNNSTLVTTNKIILNMSDSNGLTFTTESNVNKILCILRNREIIISTFDTIQLEEGSVATQYEPYKDTVKNGLILEYNGKNFFNDPQTTLLNDRSGNGNHGTPNGFDYTITSGSDGNGGIVFDGVDDYILGNYISEIEYTKSFSVEIIIKNYDKSIGTHSILQNSTNSSSRFGCVLSGASGLISFGYYDNISWKGIGGYLNDSLSENHILFTCNNTVMKLFINGIESMISTSLYVHTLQGFYIGRTSDENRPFFKGSIKKISLYNRVLSDSEITQNYLAGTSLNIPSLEDPSPIVSNLPANAYKYTSLDGIYEFTLSEELRGINDVKDRIVFDRISKKGYIERKIYKKIYNGNENTFVYRGENNTYPNSKVVAFVDNDNTYKSNTPFICNKLKYNGGNSILLENNLEALGSSAYMWISIKKDKLISNNIIGFKSWLSDQYNSSNPVYVIYQLDSNYITKIPLTFTKVTTSSKTEVPMEFIETTPSLEYPAEVYDADGKNVISHGKNLFNITGISNTVNYTVDENSLIISNGYALNTGINTEKTILSRLKPNTEYTIKSNVEFLNGSTNVSFGRMALFGPDGWFHLLVGGTSGINIRTFTTPNNIKNYHSLYIYGGGSDITLKISDIQLEEGSVATEYEPYKEFKHNLPVLRKIGDVQDTYNPWTGEYVKRISDWNILDGNLIWINNANYPNHKRFNIKDLYTNFITSSEKVYKFNSSLLNSTTAGSISWLEDNCRIHPDIGIALTVSQNDSGMSYNVSPSLNEIQAYFNGWQMCNADKISPYYKSEVPYNPTTWEEWVNMSTSSTFNNGEVTITPKSNVDCGIYMVSALKPSTKYGFLYNVVNVNTLTSLNTSQPFNWAAIPVATIGNNKLILTSNETISPNYVYFYTRQVTATGSVTLKDIRVFELPTGSQIETDFNTLTADQLNAKYTFNGLCVKHWKKLVGNSQAEIDASLTSILPTTSYDGYTPYKMIYQLAEPMVTYLDPVEIPSYEPTTIIESDALVAKPFFKAKFKSRAWYRNYDYERTIDKAQQAADEAQADANEANALLTDMASDSKLTPLEKQQLEIEWEAIQTEYTLNISQATLFLVTAEKTNYTDKYNALNTYITPLLADLTTTSDILGSNMRTKFREYYDSRTVLLNKIASIARDLANNAQQSADAAKEYAKTLNKLLVIDSTTDKYFDFNKSLTSSNGQFAPLSGYTAVLNDGKFSKCAVNAKGKLRYDKSIIPYSSFSIYGWFYVIQNHTSSTGNEGINGTWFFPLLEVATPITGTANFSLCLEPNVSPTYLKKLHFRSPNVSSMGRTINDGQWYFIAVTFDGTSYKAYVNGELDITMNGGVISPHANAVFMVGGEYNGKSNIKVDDLVITSRVLNSEEISSLYTLNQPMFDPNPISITPNPSSVSIEIL